MKKFVAWFGTLASIAGAFLMAFGIALPAYIGFTIGSGIWFAMGLIANDKPLITLNATFFVANVIGLVRILL